MEKMIDWCSTYNIDEILAMPDTKERIVIILGTNDKFIEMVKAHSRVRK